jgi:opacity protein-like surface antigen
MLRRTFAMVTLLVCLPVVSWSAQTGSDDFSWEGASAGSSLTNSNWFAADSNSSNCNGGCNGGAGGCGSTGCSDPPCGVPLYQQKYFSFFGGYSNVDSFDRSFSDSTTEYVSGFDMRDGYAAGFAVGGQMIEYVRSEFEMTYRSHEFDSFAQQEFNFSGLLLDSNISNASGSMRTGSGMFNLLFDTCPRCPGVPSLYLGGGLGAIYADGNAYTAVEEFEIQDASFAWQFIAGINYPIRRQVDLYTEYRFLGAEKLTVDSVTFGDSLGDFSYHTHNLFLGLRFRK